MPERRVWTPERIAELRRLADQQLYTPDMARMLGTTKRSVISAARRYEIQLLPRGDHSRGRSTRLSPPSGTTVARPAPPPARGRTCLYPFGHPRDDDFRFCAAKTVPGKSYCAEHLAVCTVRRGSLDEAKLTSWLAAGPRPARGRGAPR